MAKLPSEGGPKGPVEDMDPTSYGKAPKPDDKALNRLVDELADREESKCEWRSEGMEGYWKKCLTVTCGGASQ